MTEAFKPVKHHIQVKARRDGGSIRNVYWTHAPDFIEANHTPAQTTGLRYERKIEQELTLLADDLGFKLLAHKWISYNDRSLAQPDFVLTSPSGAAILIEAKYTYTDTFNQRKLYTRLLKQLGFWPITSITICHNLTSAIPRDKIIHNFHDLQQDSIWQLRI